MSRCRVWIGRARGDGPRGRCSSARQKRCAACDRMSKSRSSGRSTTITERLDGSSLSQRRCFAPPSGTMACHPSGARRSSLPDSLPRSRSYRLDDFKAVAGWTDSTVDSASGAQKMACLSNAVRGSAAKRKPPLPPEVIRRRVGSFAAGQDLIVSFIRKVAT